jgi:hypothetical protein
MYYWVQIFTMLILVLAANTGYQDFPRLSSFLAKDGFMPRWMQNRGDRLVYNGGIMVLAFLASILVLVFKADEIAMLPLYALGVMLSFSLSQSGMVHLMGRISHLKPGETLQTKVTEIHHEKGWRWKRAVNFIGAVTTSIVLVVLIITKFTEGAWVVVIAIPLLVMGLRAIKAHYVHVAESLRTRDLAPHDFRPIAEVVIVPVADVHRGTLQALRYAQRLSTDVRAVCIMTSEAMRERFMRRWQRFPEFTDGVNLICIDYEYRDVLTPLQAYITEVNKKEFPGHLVTVVIPEFVPDTTTGKLLHNQTANFLRSRLRGQEDLVIIDVPFHIHS